MVQLTNLEKHLLNEYQQGMPVTETPYADMAKQLEKFAISTNEQEVINCLNDLQERGFISRVGAVLKPQKVGSSTLAAVNAPEHRIQEVADIISAFTEVNHNYQREHEYNIWFVVTAQTEQQVLQVIEDIESKTGLSVLNLPMEEDYHIDLGFPLWC